MRNVSKEQPAKKDFRSTKDIHKQSIKDNSNQLAKCRQPEQNYRFPISLDQTRKSLPMRNNQIQENLLVVKILQNLVYCQTCTILECVSSNCNLAQQ